VSESVRGTVERTYCSSAAFTAGVLRAEDGERIRFRGRFCVSEGDCVTLSGRWATDPKYGLQFQAESVGYELPETQEGLVQYLARNPAFEGVGEATARKLVGFAGSAERLEKLLAQDIDGLHAGLRIPNRTLANLRDAWLKNAAENRIRTYLAGFGLTPKQMDKLIGQFGESVVGILRRDPYGLIKLVDGYGFKRVDQIARAMGVAKDHPGRIDAGLMYCLGQEAGSGHTWTGRTELLDLANNLLCLDGLDSKEAIGRRLAGLIDRQEMAVDGQALALPALRDAEALIRRTLEAHAQAEAPMYLPVDFTDGMNAAQLRAYRLAARRRICVITGGAGTGKTFVISRLAAAFTAAGVSVALCAPTGKAAKRIEEFLKKRGVELGASTIHRLLRYDGRAFNRPSLSEPDDVNADRLDPGYQAVVVDEVSMVDAPLMAEVLRRVDFGKTRLILVGDHNQLPPVGAGNVLRDLVGCKLAPTVVLDSVVRQAGVLKANSSSVLAGRIAPTAGSSHGWVVVDGLREPLQIQGFIRDLVRHEIPKLPVPGEAPGVHFDPLRDVQIVTPMHKGPLGTRELNRMLQHLFHGDVRAPLVPGDKVIQTSNDYELGVMNGTIGYVAGVLAGSIIVSFDGAGQREVAGEKRHNLQLAYALTAHKSQGSEFPCAVVVCHRSHFFADRNWLYTAVTRAAKTCILIGDRWGLDRAVGRNLTIGRRTFLSKWAAEWPAPRPDPAEVGA